ncbi:hypothetical protein IMY05_010G0063000 [Salix suchowensis]|nr:hypothetical protein IMY05_010G0063000 [Salix suchowensis]
MAYILYKSRLPIHLPKLKKKQRLAAAVGHGDYQETNFSSKSLATTGVARGISNLPQVFNIYIFHVSSQNDCIDHPSSSFSHQNLKVFPKLKKES